jgi:serine/threonine protein kinase
MSNRPLIPPRPDPDDDPDKTVLAATRPGVPVTGPTAQPDADESAYQAAHQAAQGSSNNTLPIGTRVAEFEITGVIGEGGFGIVYRADDHQLKRTVALKEYMPSALAARQPDLSISVKSSQHVDTFLTGLRSFINEAQLLAQFDHPSLVKVFRFWEANKTAYMVMPLYEGGTLKQALKARIADGLPTPSEAWLRKLLAPLLDALEVLHAADCLHRDIAPDNILLVGGEQTASGDPRPVLLDFGAARRVIGESTQALTVILKPGYAPIEQYDEIPSMKQGPWTDLYALAAVVHYVIVGKAPPPSVGRLVRDQYIPLAQLDEGRYRERYSDAFLAAMDTALAPQPEARPQNAAQFRALLAATEVAVPAPAPVATVQVPTAAPAPIEAPRRRSWGGLVWLGTGMFVLFVALGVLLSDWLSLRAAAPNRSTNGKATVAESTANTEPANKVPEPVKLEPAAAAPAAQASDAAAKEPDKQTAVPDAATPADKAAGAQSAPAAATAPPPGAIKTEKSDAADKPRAPQRPPARRPPAKQAAEKKAPTVVAKAEPRPAAPTAPSGTTAPGALPKPQTYSGIGAPGGDGRPLPAAVALRDARVCLIEKRFSCTIELADGVLKTDPGNAEALELARLARRAQEDALSSDWKMR